MIKIKSNNDKRNNNNSGRAVHILLETMDQYYIIYICVHCFLIICTQLKTPSPYSPINRHDHPSYNDEYIHLHLLLPPPW